MRFATRLAGFGMLASLLYPVGSATQAAAADSPLIHEIAGSVADGDGGPASSAYGRPTLGVADSSGDVFFLDRYRIREISATSGNVSTVVGDGYGGLAHAGVSAASTELDGNDLLAVTPDGKLYFADDNALFTLDSSGDLQQISYIDRLRSFAVASDGSIVYTLTGPDCRVYEAPAASTTSWDPTVIAGDGTCAEPSGSAPATSTAIGEPTSIAVDPAGSVYIEDGAQLDRIDTTGNLDVLASWQGAWSAPEPADGTSALNLPGRTSGFAVDSNGAVYLYYNCAGGISLEQVSPSGLTERAALPSASNDAFLTVTPDAAIETTYDSDTGQLNMVAESLTTGAATPLLSTGNSTAADGTPPSQAGFRRISSLTQLPNGDLVFIADGSVRVVTSAGQLGTVPVTGGTPYLVATGPTGTIDIALATGYNASEIVNIAEDGTGQNVIAGGGTSAPWTAPQPANTVHLPVLADILAGPDGTVYATDENDQAVEIVTPQGQLTSVAADVQSAPLAWNPITQMVEADSNRTLYTISQSGSLNPIGTGYGEPFAVGSDGSRYFANGDAVMREYPDGSSADIAGSGTERGNEIPAYGAAMSVTDLLVHSDGSIVIADAGWGIHGLPATPATLRLIDPGYVPVVPTAPSVTASSPAPGEIALTIPAAPTGTSYWVDVVPAGYRLDQVWTAYDSENPPPGTTTDPDGTEHAVITQVGSQSGSLQLGRTVRVVAGAQIPGASSAPVGQTIPVMPSGLQAFTAAAANSAVTISWAYPTGFSDCHAVIRDQIGDAAPTSATAGAAVYNGAARSVTAHTPSGKDITFAGFLVCSSPTSTSPASTATLTGTELTIGLRKSSRPSSKRILVQGNLATPANGGLKGYTVAIQTRPSASRKWSTLTSARSASKGVVVFAVPLHKRAQYRLLFAGARSLLGSNSATVKTT